MEAKLDAVLEKVGKDKNIEKSVLIGALEQAILPAAKRTFGMARDMEAKYNAESGSVDLFLIINVVEDDAIDGRELTDKGYINQRVTIERRAALVERLYAEPPHPDVILVD